MRLSYSVIKRFFDLVLSFLLLVVLTPLFVIVSFLVFLVLGLPIFFVQYRPGLDCNLIPLFKFRTMRISSSNIVLGVVNPLMKPANIKNGKIEFIFRRFNIKTRAKKIINCAGIVTNKNFFLKFLALIA